MHGAQGLQQRHLAVCGKVPYRLSGGFRPVRHLHPLMLGPGADYPPVGPYKQKSLERADALIEAGLRKRKREGLSLIFASARPVAPARQRAGSSVFVQWQ
jgi:hypothetical protein